MSTLKTTRDAVLFDESAIAGAVALLADAARRDFPSVEAQLKAAGFGITGYETPQEIPKSEIVSPTDIGAVIEGRGIYHGPWQPRSTGPVVHAYSDTDLLKDASGRRLLLTWYKARDELGRRNGGRLYGDGTEAALHDAVAKPSGEKGAYKDGDLVMGPQVLLNGGDNEGNKVRTGRNTADLLNGSKNNAFSKIAETLRAGSDNARWSWSCTEGRDFPYNVRAVRLSDGNDDWFYRDINRLGVLPFRLFREPHAVKAVSHLNI